MGYKLPSRVARIEFEPGHQFHGAEVELNLDLPIQLLFRFQNYGQAEADNEAILREFGDRALVSWNLDYPANGDGMLQATTAFVGELLTQWVRAVSEVPAPLEKPSPDTASSVTPLVRTVSG